MEGCWTFFSDSGNLTKITPPSLRFAVNSDLPPQIRPGLMIRYTVSPLYVPMTWVTEITRVRALHYFVDEQRVGPYRLWHREHLFRPLSAGQTQRCAILFIMFHHWRSSAGS